MSSPTWTISALADEFGITPRTLRFYEDAGIVAPLREGSRRVFRARDRARLKLALRGKRLGLSLAEIRTLIDLYESPDDTQRQMAEFQRILAEHRAMLERKRDDIDQLLAEIAQQEMRCSAALGAHSPLAGHSQSSR